MLHFLRRLDRQCALIAGLAATCIWFLSGNDPYWSDWGEQDGTAVRWLMHGDVDRFIELAPASHLGSLIIRSPLFLLAAVFGGTEDHAFYVAKTFALLVVAGFAAWLLTSLKSRGVPTKWLLLAAFVIGANPIMGMALDYGHAEDLLAATAAITGVLAARSGKLTISGVLLGLAIALKQWPVVALLPAAVVAPRAGWRIVAIAAPIGFALLASSLLLKGGAAATAGLQTDSGDIWRAHQLFWPLGVDNPDPNALRPKLPPEWFVSVPRMIVVGLSVPLSLLWLRRRRRHETPSEDVLLLVAVLFFGRALLEPWNIDYYHLPMLLALATWEVLRGRVPILALLGTAGTWFSFQIWTEIQVYGNATYLVYLSWTLPLAFVMVRQLLFPDLRIDLAVGRRAGNPQGVQPVGR